MRRVLDGILFEGKPVADEWDVRVHDLGGGQREATVSQVVQWVELKRLTPDELALWEKPLSEEEEAEKREANRKRAARRAKTKIRRLVKARGLDALLTLTYKANQTDLALCKRHLKEFVRRLKRTLHGFQYVAAFERQDRGAWHVHMATHRLPFMLRADGGKGPRVKSFGVVRAIWRSVTGELGGNIDQQRQKVYSKHSLGRLAAYLSKYMMKAFDDGDDWSNRYSASVTGDVPAVQKARFVGDSLATMVDFVYNMVADGAVDVFTWLSRFGESFYISTEPESAYRGRMRAIATR